MERPNHANSSRILISSQTKSPSTPPSTRKTSKQWAGFGTTSKQDYKTRYETKVTHGNGDALTRFLSEKGVSCSVLAGAGIRGEEEE